MEYNELFSQVETILETIHQESSKHLPDLAVPQYSSIRERKTLYSSYGQVAELSYHIADTISTAYALRANIRSLKTLIAKDKETPHSLLEPKKLALDRYLALLEDYIKALLAQKDGVDTLSRFYSSAQYILGSPRLDGVMD